jgi:hypothetical protein
MFNWRQAQEETMSKERLPELPRLSELIETLAGLSNRFEGQLERAIAIGVSHINGEDHLVIAALRRALDNIQGMLAMVDQRNMFCGMPIVRFQIDTALTLFGRRLIADVDDYVTHMMMGNERRRYRDRENREMTDAYLHRKLTGDHEHTSDLYSESSGFIHFSTHHLHRVLDLDHHQRTGGLAFRPHDEIVAGWSDEEIRGALVQFLYASGIILSECEIWEEERGMSNSSTSQGIRGARST